MKGLAVVQSSKPYDITEYYDDFLHYYELSKFQEEHCNLGLTRHIDSPIEDDLLKQVPLLDFVQRRWAGFMQVIWDAREGWTPSHPYWKKMQADQYTWDRYTAATAWTGPNKSLGLPEWLYVFILHRVTGSGINYASRRTGYCNTIIPYLGGSTTIEEMAEKVKNHTGTFFTSVGYQFPRFPKPIAGYRKGGDYYLCEFAPRLARDLASYLESSRPKKLEWRHLVDWMCAWNQKNSLTRYVFQYGAIVSDIFDFYPEFCDLDSSVYYGSNAQGTLGYIVKSKSLRGDALADVVVRDLSKKINMPPYEIEDMFCDYVRFVQHYCRPGGDYNMVDRDAVFSSSYVKHCPHGRQKAMLDMGLVKSFNSIPVHPAHDYVITSLGLSEEDYTRNYKKWISSSSVS